MAWGDEYPFVERGSVVPEDLLSDVKEPSHIRGFTYRLPKDGSRVRVIDSMRRTRVLEFRRSDMTWNEIFEPKPLGEWD